MEQEPRQPKEPLYTFVRNGEMYHTDKDTESLLRAAQRYDEREARWNPTTRPVSEFVFEHGRDTGRIQNGSAYGTAQTQAPTEKPEQARAQSQGISQ